jgi:hypothetical protein
VLVDGGPGDVGTARDVVHRPLPAALAEQVAGGVDDAAAGVGDGDGALAEAVGTRTHGARR